jgi:hypothetical protein
VIPPGHQPGDQAEAPPTSASAGDPPRAVLALIHHHPGRLRVRAEAFRDDAAVELVRLALDAETGISSVTHNAKTGSLLIMYQPGLAQPETILRIVAASANLEMPLDDGRITPREPALVAIDAAREVNEMVYELADRRVDLRSLVPAGMAALAAYSFVFHPDTRLPRWDNLLYWSYNIFSQLHRREIETGTGLPDAGASKPSEHQGGSARKPPAT